MSNLAELLERRSKVIRPTWGQVRKLADSGESYVSTSDGEVVPDKGKMACRVVISTQAQDRSRDIVLTPGIKLQSHKANPIVLLDHGYGSVQGSKSGIGKAEDESGQYTVIAEPTRLLATTHFSQKSELAEQCFDLIVEGILRGASIQFIPHKSRFLPDDVDAMSFFPGLLIEECELIEYSHTILPDNQECLVQLESVLGKGRLAGRPILAEIRKSLSIHVPEKHTSVNVPAEVPVSKTVTEPVKTPAPIMKDAKPDDPLPDPVRSDSVADNPTDREPEDKRPPGARAMSGLHERFMEMAGFLEDQMQGQEPGSGACDVLNELAGLLDEKIGGLAESYASLYPDLDGLMDYAKDSEPDDDDTMDKGGGDDEPSYPDEDDTEDARPKKNYRADTPSRQKLRKHLAEWKKTFATKGLNKRCRAAVKDAADYLDIHHGHDNLDTTQKTCIKYHAKELRGVEQSGASSDPEPEPMDTKAIKALADKVAEIEQDNRRLKRTLSAARAGR